MILNILFLFALIFGAWSEVIYCQLNDPTPENKRFLFSWLVLMMFAVALFVFSGCTPRQHAEFHVASVTINGERTVTDFLLTNNGE